MVFTYTWESTMGVCKPFKSDGELDITRANNILNFKVLAVAMRKRKHKGNFKRQQHKTNQKKFKNMHTYVLYLCVCEIERERERETLNLAAKPSFWIIRAYCKTKYSFLNKNHAKVKAFQRETCKSCFTYQTHLHYTSVYSIAHLWKPAECICLLENTTRKCSTHDGYEKVARSFSKWWVLMWQQKFLNQYLVVIYCLSNERQKSRLVLEGNF
jgi:hypothetical protein